MWLLLLLLAALEVEPRCARYGSSPPRLSEMCCCSQRDGWSCASANAPPSGGFEGRPRCCCHGPAYALLRVALAGAPCVLGRVGGRIGVRKRRRTAPTRSRLRWLTLPGVGLPSRYRGIRHLVGNWFTSYPCQRPSRDRGMPWDRPVSLELV